MAPCPLASPILILVPVSPAHLPEGEHDDDRPQGGVRIALRGASGLREWDDGPADEPSEVVSDAEFLSKG